MLEYLLVKNTDIASLTGCSNCCTQCSLFTYLIALKSGQVNFGKGWWSIFLAGSAGAWLVQVGNVAMN